MGRLHSFLLLKTTDTIPFVGGSEKFPEMFKLESFVSIFKVEHTGDTTEYEPERDKIKDSAMVQDSAPPPECASHFGIQIILS